MEARQPAGAACSFLRPTSSLAWSCELLPDALHWENVASVQSKVSSAGLPLGEADLGRKSRIPQKTYLQDPVKALDIYIYDDQLAYPP